MTSPAHRMPWEPGPVSTNVGWSDLKKVEAEVVAATGTPEPARLSDDWDVVDLARVWSNGLGQLLLDSGISTEVAKARGYHALCRRLDALGHGFSLAQAERVSDRSQALLVPLWDVTNITASPSGYQMRPSRETEGRDHKYETPPKQANFLDINPSMRPKVLDASETLWVTEGARKVDALASIGVPCIGLIGVWNWRGKDDPGNKKEKSKPLPQWKAIPLRGRSVVICFDSDAEVNDDVQNARAALERFLRRKGAQVSFTVLPQAVNGDKQGIDDYLGAGGKLSDVPVVPGDTRDPRPKFVVDNPADVYDQLENELGTGPLYGFFRRDGNLVYVPSIGEDGYEPPAEGSDGPAQVRPVLVDYLRATVQSRFFVCKSTPTDDAPEYTHTLTPHDSFKQAVEAAGEWPNVPLVRLVTHTPILRADGSVLATPGYDVDTQTLFLPGAELDLPPFPHVIDDATEAWAVEHLDYLLVDFPFETPESRANVLALLLTPLVRLVLPPPYPLIIMNAHQPGSGKTLLADVARALHGGVQRPELPQNDDELRKQITGILATTTAPVVVWDNADAIIKSPILAGLLTSTSWNDRLLGRNKDISAINDRIWVTTGNNVDIGGDMARRCYWTHLDPNTPRPETRTGFREPDLLGYIKRNRGQLLTALLVIARRWVQASSPTRNVRADSYSTWAGAMTEMLHPFGLSDAFANQTQIAATLSDDDEELATLLAALAVEFGDVPFQVKDAVQRTNDLSSPIRKALPVELFQRQAHGDDIGRSLGKYLARKRQRYAGPYRVVDDGEARGGKRWRIEMTGQPS